MQEKSVTKTQVKSKESVDDKDKLAPSKNIAGPPVYYPPNHELFLKKEEASGESYRAQVISVILCQSLLIASSFFVLGWICAC